ncbi:SDR family NAD(P)-dependent oxidoreductase [Thermocrispum sp.]|jgi:NAD(P)-dependent dehydrogenase (short-subunit alcohol dehydrogenase family)|uniref:3-hydroxyacyl-CoA dehydrogenase n=1 Tax=Thermocrispum agreste TaxID=37925 RepID=A0A2W4LQH2_9PSEU|nr:SDR family NAD(P)-dependent oxidoreductase [Thermocrispum sp.]PZM99853.1 MAG: 3-hydroxyacyl-CoA dehydrogenase [Thermocrispum agreste]
MEIVGKTVVVTGAGSGLGRATAERMLSAGAKVALLDANEKRAEEVARGHDDTALVVRVDVTDPAQVESAVKAVKERFDAIHVCVNAAGAATPGLVTDGEKPLPLEAFRKVIDVNLIGTFDVMRHCVTAMAANDPVDGERGVVVNVSSGAWNQGQRGQAAYAASKAGIVGLTLPTARDVARLGIRVTAIAPGLFDTAMADGLSPKVREGLERMILHPPRLGRPEEFAALVQHIVENKYLNATTISLDAGVRMA